MGSGVIGVIVMGVEGWRELDAGREWWVPETGREGVVELMPDTGREDDRERPDARRDTAGDGGAGREEVREVTDWVLSLWSGLGGTREGSGGSWGWSARQKGRSMDRKRERRKLRGGGGGVSM